MQGRSTPDFGRIGRQGGVTTLGFIILVVFVGLFAFAFIRLAPVYLNYMKVSGVVNGVYEEFDGEKATRGQILSSISRRFDVESVSRITARDIAVTPVEGGYEVKADYDDKTPFIANVSFSVHFNKTVLVRR